MDSRLRGNDTEASITAPVIPAKAGIHAEKPSHIISQMIQEMFCSENTEKQRFAGYTTQAMLSVVFRKVKKRMANNYGVAARTWKNFRFSGITRNKTVSNVQKE